MEIMFCQYTLMGGVLGNITNIGIFVGSSAKSPPIFALIGNDDFGTDFVLNS